MAMVALGVGAGQLAFAGGTSTSTTTSTSSSTTTSTVQQCIVEDSLASAQCRALVLVGILQARGTVKGNKVLQNQIERAQGNMADAATKTGAQARAAYRRAASALKSFNVRLRSAAGKKQVDPATRTQLLDLSKPLQQTVIQLMRQTT
jgi:hypothetical protein